MNAKELKNILVPTAGQVLACALGSVVLYLVAFYDVLTNLFFGRSQDLQPYFYQSYQTQLSRLSGLPVIDFLVKAGFWAGVGLIAYIIFLVISNVIIEARNEAVVETEYINKGRLDQRLRKPLWQLGLAVLLVISIIVSIVGLLPIWFGLFSGALVGVLGLGSVLIIVVALVATATNIYLLWALGQLVFSID